MKTRASTLGAAASALAVSVALLIATAGSVQAQSNAEGYITGDVVTSDGPAAGVSVTAKNLDTGYTRSTTTGETGGYRFGSLPTGRYEVSASQEGYESRPATVNVQVGQGTPVNMVLFRAGQVIDEVLVEGQVQTFDTSVAETSTVVTAADLEKLPVVRDIGAVALMAPGAVQGDTIFGGGADKTRQNYGSSYFGLASFGGSSVAENAYYINGFNVTNFRNGLGGATLPFQFYDQFQIKTGGFGAEFGRSTGGVINAVTKRGSNDWDMGVGTYYTPESLRGHSPDVADPNNPGQFDSVYTYDTNNERETYAYFSGPIVKDRLFFYANYTSRNNDEYNYTGGSILNHDVDDAPFWGIKLDWNINDNHILEYTGFNDTHAVDRTTFAWDEATRVTGDQIGTSTIARGGKNDILRYTGHFGDNVTLSVLHGKGKYDLTSGSSADESCPAIYDSRTGGLTQIGCWVTFLPETGLDEREATRVDAEWSIGDRHVMRFGIDSENNTSINSNFYSGHHYYRYYPATPGDTLSNGAIVPAGVTEVVRDRVLESGGAFKVKTDALYFEDEWYLNDNVTLRLGVRNERFDNRNAADETFIKITNQWAPRLGISWDMKGDGSSKLYATVGRYHLPIATNTNIRLSGAELFTEDWYVLNAVNADSTPNLGAKIGGTNVFGDGSVPDVRTVLDSTIEPMYQDEYIIGYERNLGTKYVGGLSLTYRDLKSAIEDVTIDAAIGLPGEFAYILTNPGTAVHTFYDANGDGVPEEYYFTADQMGFPKAKRKYWALTASLERVASDKLTLRGSYTYSHSYGNVEGYVRSDNGQDDAGLTTNFDFPGLMEGSYGDLPNDRPHQLKVFTSYQISDQWSVDGSFVFQSGRPINAFGLHPTDPYAVLYGAESFYRHLADGTAVFSPRGCCGRTDSIRTVNMGFTYQKRSNRNGLTARVDIFNLFDSHGVTEVDEIADEESGTPSPTYGLPKYFQQPRQVRFGIQYDFGGNGF